ncbi:MAG TPA: type II toxin-antitoxin system VapC family toxin [Candidatus Limnocylindria bacterium]|jgi:predicted nucleic acid-binding protein|nr:type II toxin-antitoxin system VapC family toxin [Candidatus Limnocylindria bacterium]
MAWVIDTCVLIDVRLNDPIWALRSATCLNTHMPFGLVISPVTFVELAPAFDGDMALQRQFLTRFGISHEEVWRSADTEQCFRLWHDWIRRKRQGQTGKRPLADALIAAFASRHQGLITRNSSDFAQISPLLPLVCP